ncbi:pantetheine-phosphate adenylyltransferase [Verrucomicrobiaceae bacterium 227]
MQTAVYAGSFDPPTNGHLWMISQGLQLFDRLVVAIGQNPSKNYTFSTEERIELLHASIPSCERLTITHFDNRYLVDYAREVGAGFILRGIRSPQDYEYERVMRHINGDMAPKINTVFLMPPRDIAELSSSMVMGLIGPGGWQDTVRRYVPSPVFDSLLIKQSESDS